MTPTPKHYRLFTATYMDRGITRDLMIGAMDIKEARQKAVIASEGHELINVREIPLTKVLV